MEFSCENNVSEFLLLRRMSAFSKNESDALEGLLAQVQ